MPHPRSKHALRPEVESAEARVLATVGLAAAAPPAVVHALAKAPSVQSWVEITNPTKQAVKFELSANGGLTYHNYTLHAKSSASYHANHSAKDFLIKFGDGPSTSLPTETTKSHEPAYALQTSLSVVPVQDGGGGGIAGPTIQGPITIVNMTSSSTGPGGVAVTLDLSFNGGGYKKYTIPYTNGQTPTIVHIPGGTTKVVYKLPANPTIPPTQLTSFGTYTLFVNTIFQPYLFPSS